MKPLTNAIREKIKMNIKNGIDISPLIEGVEIGGENFDGAIIKTFNRFNEDISGTSFVRATIGEEGKITNLGHCKATGCNFKRTKFLGTLDIRSIDARNCNFCGAYMPNTDYRNGNFLGSLFCGTVFTFSDWAGKGAKFDKKVFEMIFKHWGIEIDPDKT